MLIIEKLKKFWKGFLSGPSWMQLPDWLTIKKYNYRSSGIMLFIWCHGLYQRVFSLPARFIIVVYLFVAFYSTIRFDSLGSVLFFVITALFLIDFLISCFFFIKAEARRDYPERLRCNIPFKIRYRIKNLRSVPAFDIAVDPYLKFKGMERYDVVPYAQIPGRDSIQFEINCCAKKRGIFRVNKLILESCFPFNLIKFSRGFPEPVKNIICHPACYDIESIRTVSGESLKSQSLFSLPNVGESMDFHGCRDFRYGDSRRKIHWRASAKYGSLVVKEFQEEHQNRASIILDTMIASNMPTLTKFVPHLKFLDNTLVKGEEKFEAAVSLTASIASALVAQGFMIENYMIGDHIVKNNSTHDVDTLLPLLDHLSAAKYSLKDPFSTVSNELLESFALNSIVVLVLLRNDKIVKDLYNNILMNGINVTALLVTGEDDISAPWAKIVPPKNILAGEISL